MCSAIVYFQKLITINTVYSFFPGIIYLTGDSVTIHDGSSAATNNFFTPDKPGVPISTTASEPAT